MEKYSNPTPFDMNQADACNQEVNYTCYYGESNDCDKTTENYTFDWEVDQLKNPKFQKYRTTLDVALCPSHYNKILENNHGEKPLARGETAEEATDFILYYIESTVDVHNSECQGSCYSECCGTKKTYVFVWHYRERAKNGNAEYYTTIPLSFCEHHYQKVLEKNDGEQPFAYGWDNWDAIDSVVACLDEITYKYQTIADLRSLTQEQLVNQFMAIALP